MYGWKGRPDSTDHTNIGHYVPKFDFSRYNIAQSRCIRQDYIRLLRLSYFVRSSKLAIVRLMHKQKDKTNFQPIIQQSPEENYVG